MKARRFLDGITGMKKNIESFDSFDITQDKCAQGRQDKPVEMTFLV
jgi:hypothetical protein